MTSRIFDTTQQRWRTTHPHLWSADRGAWEENLGGMPGGFVSPSLHHPVDIAAGSIWKRVVEGAAMPLAANSSVLANWMWTQTPTRFKTVTGTPSDVIGSTPKTSLNTSTQNTQTIATVIVDSTDPYCHYQYMDSASLPGNRYATEANDYIIGKIPWPAGFTPALNGDRGLCIIDIGTGIIREWFNVNAVANKPGHWTASTGGYSVNPAYSKDWGSNWATQYRGSNAVVKIHNALGFIGINEIRTGKIEHALAFTMANATGDNWPNVPASYPALASDGKFPPASWSGWAENGGANGAYPGPSPRHGQWGRLKSDVDPMNNPRTGRPYNALTRLLIPAAKKYGLVGTDTNAICHSFNGESGNAEKALKGTDPWTSELGLRLNPYSAAEGYDVSDFPWDLTEWAPIDWQRPNPDFFLRSGESNVYEPH